VGSLLLAGIVRYVIDRHEGFGYGDVTVRSSTVVGPGGRIQVRPFSDAVIRSSTVPGDLQRTDPRLRPPADNGGPTETFALLSGSPAIDAGSCPDEARDQRGRSRPVDDPLIPNADDACDIGAYEKQ
jgi:hypothetical protein